MQFESLEGRVALTTGMSPAALTTGMAPPMVAAVKQPYRGPLPVHFTGHVTLKGTQLSSTDLVGSIGDVKFKGTFKGTFKGQKFLVGSLDLSNSQGTLHANLFPKPYPPVKVVPVKGTLKVKAILLIGVGTRKYHVFDNNSVSGEIRLFLQIANPRLLDAPGWGFFLNGDPSGLGFHKGD